MWGKKKRLADARRKAQKDEGSLSQEEIDALLQGTDDVGTSIPRKTVIRNAEQFIAPKKQQIVKQEKEKSLFERFCSFFKVT